MKNTFILFIYIFPILINIQYTKGQLGGGSDPEFYDCQCANGQHGGYYCDYNQILCASCYQGYRMDGNECTQCTGGKYQASNNFNGNSCTTCANCPAGKFVDEDCTTTSNRECESCTGASGNNQGFSNSVNQDSCTPCTTCTNTEHETQACTSTQNRVCANNDCNCPGGTVVDVCYNDGSTACQSCDTGYYMDNGVCKQCAAGYGGENCGICAAGKYSAQGSDTCSDCASGKYSAQGSAECTDCDIANVNTHTSEGGRDEAGDCRVVTCDSGYHKTSDTECSACSTCSAGTHETTACTTTSNRACSTCSTCSAGTYETTACSATSNRECESCAAGKYQSNVNQVSCEDCTSATANERGSWSASGASACTDCTQCAPGEYAATACTKTADTGTCTPCSDTSFQSVLTSFKTSCTDHDEKCAAGTPQTAGTDTADRICGNACPAGQYVAAPANAQTTTSCASCTAGSMTDTLTNTGGTTCTKCDEGKFSPVSTVACAICTGNTYQDQLGQTSCNDCPAGTQNYKDDTIALNRDAASDCTVCPTSEYTEGNGVSCVKCPEGTFMAAHGSDGVSYDGTNAGTHDSPNDCTVCSANQYQDETGQTSCKSCPVGTENTNTGGGVYSPNGNANFNHIDLNRCTLCPDNKLNLVAGTACDTNCPAGTDRVHQDNEEGCGLGNSCDATNGWTGAWRVENCNICGESKYSISGETCTDCPVGTFMGNKGDEGLQYQPGVREGLEHAEVSSCTICPLHQYQPNVGQTSCIQCTNEQGDNDNDRAYGTGSSNHTDAEEPCGVGNACNVGGYAPANTATSCDLCPEGFYGVTGQECEQCLNTYDFFNAPDDGKALCVKAESTYNPNHASLGEPSTIGAFSHEQCAATECIPGARLTGTSPNRCEKIFCAVNQHVVNHVCTDCTYSEWGPAGRDATGPDTVCYSGGNSVHDEDNTLPDQQGIEAINPESGYEQKVIYSDVGSLHVNKYGYLVDLNGLLLVGKAEDGTTDENAKHHIHVPSRYNNVYFSQDGKAWVMELDGGHFKHVGTIMLARFENPLGLNKFRKITTYCIPEANEFGFMLGNWCENTWLDEFETQYMAESIVSGPGIVAQPHSQGMGRIVNGRSHRVSKDYREMFSTAPGWNLIVEGRGYFQYRYIMAKIDRDSWKNDPSSHGDGSYDAAYKTTNAGEGHI
jgi:hypothetical protein